VFDKKERRWVGDRLVVTATVKTSLTPNHGFAEEYQVSKVEMYFFYVSQCIE
jgi:hypothetical protein